MQYLKKIKMVAEKSMINKILRIFNKGRVGPYVCLNPDPDPVSWLYLNILVFCFSGIYFCVILDLSSCGLEFFRAPFDCVPEASVSFPPLPPCPVHNLSPLNFRVLRNPNGRGLPNARACGDSEGLQPQKE